MSRYLLELDEHQTMLAAKMRVQASIVVFSTLLLDISSDVLVFGTLLLDISSDVLLLTVLD